MGLGFRKVLGICNIPMVHILMVSGKGVILYQAFGNLRARTKGYLGIAGVGMLGKLRDMDTKFTQVARRIMVILLMAIAKEPVFFSLKTNLPRRELT
jgi:hypothetical protein